MNRQFVFGLMLIVLSSLGAVNAATYFVDVAIPSSPAAVTYSDPLNLSVDFGFAFSDITNINLTGTFSGDLWDGGEQWTVDGYGGQSNTSTTSRSSFTSNTPHDIPFRTDLMDGLASFVFRSSIEGTSFNLASLRITIDGTQVSAVPIPAALWLFGPALLGFIRFRRKAVNTAAA